MRTHVATSFVLLLVVATSLAPPALADDACRAALQAQVKACAEARTEPRDGTSDHMLSNL